MEQLSDLARSEKLSREMTHRQQAPIESLRGQDPLTDWALGMRERTLNPLATLAGEAKRFQGLSPQDMGIEMVGGGMAGTLRKAAGKAAQKTEYELAHELAQRNAALPIEQGGLGLRANNTAMDRAKAMGFDTPAYHGSDTGGIIEFKNEFLGGNTGAKSAEMAHFLTKTPDNAETYLNYPITKELFDLRDTDAEKFKSASDELNNFLHETRKTRSSGAKFLSGDLRDIDKAKVDLQRGKITNDEYQAIVDDIDITGVTENAINEAKSHNQKIATLEDVLYKAKLQKDMKEFAIAKAFKNDGSRRLDYKPGESPSIYPLLVKNDNPLIKDYQNQPYRDTSFADLLGDAQQSGKTGAIFKNVHDPVTDDIYAVFNPSNIRSRFAAFDPFQRNSANILAGVGAGAVAMPLITDELNNMTSEQRLHNYQRGYD